MTSQAAPKRRWVLALPLLIFAALAALFWFRLGADPAKLPSALIGRAAIEWGVYGVPETFIVGRDGRIAYKMVGGITQENYERVLKVEIDKALQAGS